MYKRKQSVIVTDWIDGFPYMRYQTGKYPYAHIKVRNNFWQGISTANITITATFADQSAAQKKFGYEKKRLEFDDEYFCDYASRANIQSLLWNLHSRQSELLP